MSDAPMSKYAAKVAARARAAATATAGAERPAEVQPPQPQQCGLADLGDLPGKCANALNAAANCLDVAAKLAREMLLTARSVQRGEATSIAVMAEALAPKLRTYSVRMIAMPQGEVAK